MEFEDKKCYYDILGVDKKVEQNDLKKVYKKLALKYHPDKAPIGEEQQYKQHFQKISEAFQVLNDPQERAWYDSHRDQFLNPDREKDYTGFDFEINDYFTESCYKKDNDDETIENFYKIYQDIFIKILIEEEKARENDSNLEEVKESHLKAPNFGNRKTDLDQVANFYDYWDNFSTSLNFTWADVWDMRDGENRRVKRLIERENKRARAKAKKRYYDLLKRLLNFVKSRDERYTSLLKKIQDEKQAKQKQEEEDRIRKEQEWQKEKQDLLQQEMERYEKERQERIENGEFGQEEELQDEEILIYECKICNKEFQSENQYINHQKSKQHLKRKKKMMKDLLVNGEEFYLDQIDDQIQDINKDNQNNQTQKNKKKKKKNKKKNNNIQTTIEDIQIQEKTDEKTAEEIQREEEYKKEHEEWEKKQELKRQKKQQKKQKKQDKKQKQEKSCRLCGFEAESKTKLFKHLETEHNYQLILNFQILKKNLKQYQQYK